MPKEAVQKRKNPGKDLSAYREVGYTPPDGKFVELWQVYYECPSASYRGYVVHRSSGRLEEWT